MRLDREPTHTIELRAPTLVATPVVPTVLNHYGHLSMALDLEYWQVPELATHYHGQYRIDSHSLRAVLETVEACLR